MNVIHSIKQTDYTVIITTKSGIVRTYTFDTITKCNEYYNDITSWHYVVSSCHDKETWWYTSQCSLSTKQSIYFYNVNTTVNG